jgi:glycosyltransferase involved in cell wall biosynthesis
MGRYWHGKVLILPSGDDPWSEEGIMERYTELQADTLITLKEPWVFKWIHRLALNFVPIVPIDHQPVSEAILSPLSTAFKVVTISRFGQWELRNRGIESEYIPHGVSEVFQYYPERRAEWRKMWFFDPDEFIVGIVAMNRARKMIPQMLRGYARFRELNPDVKSHLMLWTDIYPAVSPEATAAGVADVGVNLLPEILQLGLGEAVRWPERKIIWEGIPDWSEHGWNMVNLYGTFDALLGCTGGEGAGLPFLEAAACGVPSITTDYAAGPEYVGPGYTVPWKEYVVYDTPGVRRPLADVDEMARALTKILNSDPEKLARKCVRFAENFRWEKIIERYWKPFLNKCSTELYPLITKEGIKSWA